MRRKSVKLYIYAEINRKIYMHATKMFEKLKEHKVHILVAKTNSQTQETSRLVETKKS